MVSNFEFDFLKQQNMEIKITFCQDDKQCFLVNEYTKLNMIAQNLYLP